ncbi:class I SAM-dependent methyltransferase [Marichromatium sp. AB31]|uniref:class I SAM-dependent methyltransferase n=1 Tax=Marichromatium sp. AB31 TaxID=2483362 RepID=UPI000F3C9226|nr:methyltransferase domain-containing protein [Marichromatium sp. AB31]RNE90560.1 methyltransferase domain-containing protein [Marichromatium sp. AB31]
MTACKGPDSPLAQLQRWYRSPLGTELARLECACVQQLLHDTFGYYLVQVGVTESFRDALATSRIRHRIAMPCDPPPLARAPAIVGRASQLPLASDSIDALFLPHTLDFSPDPQAVLREAERTLIPEGRLIVIGFNALSTWGLRALLRGARGPAPWCGRFRTHYQMEAWLSDLGFALERREFLMFRPPLTRALGPGGPRIETLGRRLLPALGGVYVLRAVKRVSTLTPLRPSWRGRRQLLPGRVEPTARRNPHV